MPRRKKEETEAKTVAVKKTNKNEYFSAVGRRRESIARIRLYPEVKSIQVAEEELKKGDIYVNGKSVEKYFVGEVAKACYLEPLTAINSVDKFIITAKVEGGGNRGQLEAFIHGLSRTLSAFDKENFKKVLKKKGFLTRDPRTRERRKVGTGGKARRKKQSPKR